MPASSRIVAEHRGPLVIGLDVGSTTVKAAVVDRADRAILWSDYQRHHTQQPQTVLDFLARIEASFPAVPRDRWQIFVTGSGAGPIAPHVGARFVQEVNAVTMAVEALHPDVRSVVELGGQDAKIIFLRENKETGDKTPVASMNDKCASGTGATIDKCLVKVGVPQAEVARIRFDAGKLHHVAAKCGVFAETDIVNLVKAGIPSNEILNSLADAIVMQNLSVLTRGSTLQSKVLLLGGPNTYLPFLVECWRLRIPETWRERGFDTPLDVPVEDLIFVPRNAELYAAYGAVLYGLHEAADVGRYAGPDKLADYATNGRKARLKDIAGPPLARSKIEVETFREAYRVRTFVPPVLEAGRHVRGVIGLDGGSTSSKCVLLDERGEILLKEYQLSKGNPILDMKQMLGRIRDTVAAQGATLEVVGFGVTGYAGPVLEEALLADAHVVETVAHMKSAVHYFGDVDVICDIGGQDIKVLFMRNGDIENFRLSNQCSAGNGMLLQAMADQFGVPVTAYADVAFEAELSPEFSYGCAVFLDADRVNFQKEGYAKEEMLAGLAQVLPKNVWQYVVQIPRMAELGTNFVLQGGTQHNLAAVKAQVDYILERVAGAKVHVHPHPGEAGALGAALETLRRYKRTGKTRWVGVGAAIDLAFETRTDEETRCHFCPNLCSRTFIDTTTPGGQKARHISGFSCEKGTVESEEALKELTRKRSELRRAYPNLVEWEAKELFRSRFTPAPMPADGAPVQVAETEISAMWQVDRRVVTRPFRRSKPARPLAGVRVGIPRVLNLWSTAPFFRTYLEALGIARQNVVFSDVTSEALWAAGGKYGSTDPCYPSKVTQAHIHNLLFDAHADKPLDFVLLPCITHLRPVLEHVMDHAACPIVQGVGDVMKAAFTKEQDFFAARGITYLNPALTFAERHLLGKQLFDTFGSALGVTEDESRFATEQAWLALDDFDRERQRRGRELLEAVERDNALAILMIGRPYHSDPGLNHEVLGEFQALGYPILSMGSIPKDPEWLARFFADDLASGRVKSPLDITDVWPENYSANSALKVWAAKFAARHPHVAVLDLSSFKCGHDAPIFGLIDGIIGASATPYSALHDIDANKPGGSIAIRVKTYAYTLELHRERLEDLAARKAELARRVEDKRAELKERLLREQAERHRVTHEATMRLSRAPAQAYAPQSPVGSERTPDVPRGLRLSLGRLRQKAIDLRERFLPAP